MSRNEYLAEVDAFASNGDTIKYLENGIAHFNSCGCPLSKWNEETEEVIYC